MTDKSPQVTLHLVCLNFAGEHWKPAPRLPAGVLWHAGARYVTYEFCDPQRVDYINIDVAGRVQVWLEPVCFNALSADEARAFLKRHGWQAGIGPSIEENEK